MKMKVEPGVAIHEYWPWMFSEPKIKCKHGKVDCEKCGSFTDAVAHTTVKGVGRVGQLRRSK